MFSCWTNDDVILERTDPARHMLRLRWSPSWPGRLGVGGAFFRSKQTLIVATLLMAFLLYWSVGQLSGGGKKPTVKENSLPKQDSPADNEQVADMDSRKSIERVRLCSNINDECFIVQDIRVFDTSRRFNRELVSVNRRTEVESQIEIAEEMTNDNDFPPVNASLNHERILAEYLRFMLAMAFSNDGMADRNKKVKVLFIGLGGGSLPTKIHALMPQADITAVEIDPVIIKIAKEWFGFVETPRLHIVLGDGVKYLIKTAQQDTEFDVIFVDACVAGPPSPTNDLSCPTREFTEDRILEALRRSLAPMGCVVVNLLAYSTKTVQDVQNRYWRHFPVVFSRDMNDESNTVFIALTHHVTDKKNFRTAMKKKVAGVYSELFEK